MKPKWIVEAKFTTKKETVKYLKSMNEDIDDYDISDFNDVEISVIRENNELAKISYGRSGEGKLILFDAENEGCNTNEFNWYKKAAKIFCAGLNNEYM